MAGVNHVEVFNCTPQEFFDLLKDYEKYPEFLKEVKSCKVLTERTTDQGLEKMVEYKVSVIKDITYVNIQKEEPAKSVTWKFLRGDLFKTMSGGWQLEAAPEGKTKATYTVDAEFGMFVPSMITKGVLAVNLPAMMQAYHKRVGDLYGK
jgi:coenzyme Q-binding protein COQ10